MTMTPPVASTVIVSELTKTIKTSTTTSKQQPQSSLSQPTPTPTVSTPKPALSKSAAKKRKRIERMKEKDQMKKARIKAAKVAKAIAEGRDIEAERMEQEKNRLSGVGFRKREALWRQRINGADTSFKICIDCSFEDQMTSKEIGSLSNQIRYCYAANKRNTKPIHLSISSLSGSTLNNLSRCDGFPNQWILRAFTYTDQSLLSLHTDPSRVVYLTECSDTILDTLVDGDVYVIGGIVDRNRLKGVTREKAKEMGVRTAALPIDKYLKKGKGPSTATKVLTCNHVFEILLKFRENGGDWGAAMLDVLPTRRGDGNGDSDGDGGRIDDREVKGVASDTVVIVAGNETTL